MSWEKAEESEGFPFTDHYAWRKNAGRTPESAGYFVQQVCTCSSFLFYLYLWEIVKVKFKPTVTLKYYIYSWFQQT